MLPRILLLVLILSCWWIVPPSAAVPPACPSLDARGFISSTHYFIREATDVILCLNLDGSGKHRFCFPGRSIYEPKLSRRNPNWLYFLTETSGTVTPGGPYSLIGGDLIDSSTWVVADLPCVFPHHTVMVEEAGIDFALIWERGVSIWKSGKEQIFETPDTRRLWDLSYDAARKRLMWLTTTDQEAISAWDEHLPMRKIGVNEFDLTSRRTTNTPVCLPQSASLYRLMENSKNKIILMGWRAKEPDLWKRVCAWFGFRFHMHFSEALISYNRETGAVQEVGSFDDLHLWDHRSQWMTASTPLSSGSASLINWKTGENIVRQDTAFYGLEVTSEGDPVVMTQDSVLVFDQETLRAKSRYETPLLKE